MSNLPTVCIVGGGVVGLAVAARLSSRGRARSVTLLDRNKWLAAETSSRNSEVVHAGIYYQADSLKTRHCIRGRELLYDLCKAVGIPHRKVGKLIVPSSSIADSEYLEKRYQHAKQLQVPVEFMFGLGLFDVDIEGIIDSHALVSYLEATLLNAGGIVSLRTTVQDIEYDGSQYTVSCETDSRTGKPVAFSQNFDVVINSGGLWADKVASMLRGSQNSNVDYEGKLPYYKIYPCAGRYFSLGSKKDYVKHLIYPVPSGSAGPDAEYADEVSYNLPVEKTEMLRSAFWDALSRLMIVDYSFRDYLTFDYIGFRPKLFRNGEPVRDFVIQEESRAGFPGFVNLVGIESPGLTACLSIAEHVDEILFG